jgi:preprotein translocase subunit Sss1
MRGYKKVVRDITLSWSKQKGRDVRFVQFTRQYRSVAVCVRQGSVSWNDVWLLVKKPNEKEVLKMLDVAVQNEDGCVKCGTDDAYLSKASAWRAKCSCRTVLVMFKKPGANQKCSCGKTVQKERFAQTKKEED